MKGHNICDISNKYFYGKVPEEKIIPKLSLFPLLLSKIGVTKDLKLPKSSEHATTVQRCPCVNVG